MALSAFDDKSHPPDEAEVDAVLGRSAPHWHELRRRIAAGHPSITEEWGFTSKTTGWGLRLKRGSRVVLYLAPGHGHFRASFALGEKAVRAAREIRLPAAVLEAIDAAPRYAEGRGVRLEVRTARDVGYIEKLAAIKVAN